MLGGSGPAAHRHLIGSDRDDYLGKALWVVPDGAGRRGCSASVSISMKCSVVYCIPKIAVVDRVAANEPACTLNPDQCAGNPACRCRAEHERSRSNDTHRDRVVEGVAALTGWSTPVQPPKRGNCRRLTLVELATGLTDRYDTYGLRMCRMLHSNDNECYVRRRVSVGLCVGCEMRSRGDWRGDVRAKPHGVACRNDA
jgi:hypothetical protein